MNFLFSELKVAMYPCKKALQAFSSAFHHCCSIAKSKLKSLSDLASYYFFKLVFQTADSALVTLNLLFVPLYSRLCRAFVTAVPLSSNLLAIVTQYKLDIVLHDLHLIKTVGRTYLSF